MPMSMLGNSITLTLDRPVYGGSSLGYYNSKAVLVPFGVPGDTVHVMITEDKKDYCIGKIESYAQQSDARIFPACVNFEQCGGCDYLHVAYETELLIKQRIMGDTLVRIAGLSGKGLPDIKIVSARRFNYRSHAEIKIKDGRAGFYRKNSHAIVPIPESGCLLLPEEINRFIKKIPLTMNTCKVALDASGRIAASFQGVRAITEKAGGFVLQRGLDQFFQVNRHLRQEMLDAVASYAAISRDDTLLDIGCGVGFFTICLARKAKRVTGIDINKESIGRAKCNARLNGIGNIDFFSMPASHIHPVRHYSDVVVIDPPRAGIDMKTRKTLCAMNPGRIVYISCNPATFSRDAKDFTMAGFSLGSLMLIDMFPCTHHIEIISLFNRA